MRVGSSRFVDHQCGGVLAPEAGTPAELTRIGSRWRRCEALVEVMQTAWARPAAAQRSIAPPSTWMAFPVSQTALSETRKAISSETSSGSPARPSGNSLPRAASSAS